MQKLTFLFVVRPIVRSSSSASLLSSSSSLVSSASSSSSSSSPKKPHQGKTIFLSLPWYYVCATDVMDFFSYANRYKRVLQRPNIIEICSSCTQLPWRCKLYKYRGIFLLYMPQWVLREWCLLWWYVRPKFQVSRCLLYGDDNLTMQLYTKN